jgi:ribosomal protein S18 acetylase RimI-like enzyme
MENNDITISEVHEFSSELADALRKLVAQLGDDYQELTDEDIRQIIASGTTHLLIAKDTTSQEIVGMTTLVSYRIPFKMKGWIEDIVVDDAHRRRGIGEALMRKAIVVAKEVGVKTLDLTSRPERESANAFYVRFGFEKRNTNVYRMNLG